MASSRTCRYGWETSCSGCASKGKRYEELLGQLEGPDKTAAKDGILLTFPSNLIRSVDQDLRALSYPPRCIIDYEELRKCALTSDRCCGIFGTPIFTSTTIVYAAQKMTAVDLASIGVDSRLCVTRGLKPRFGTEWLDALSFPRRMLRHY